MTQSLAQRATQVREAVTDILARFPETRGNDKALMLRYWYEVDRLVFDYTFPQRFVSGATSPESISRARRAIQAQGLYLPSEETQTRRDNNRAELTEHYATT
jgi:hypothetical protein